MPEEARPRTNTRLRGEAPPGLQFTSEEGRQRIGRYEVIKTIGKGAMGIVYMGKDPKIGRTVAIKTMALTQEFEPDELAGVKERFFRDRKSVV